MRRPPRSAVPRSPTTGSTMRCSTPRRRGPLRCTTCPRTPGEEISAEVLYGSRQRIWDQAENRRHAQKALLELLCGTCMSLIRDLDRAAARPQRGDELGADGRFARLRRGGRRAARRRRLCGVRRWRRPGRPRARGRAQAQAQLRPRTHPGGARAEPRADTAARRASRRAVAGVALRAPASRSSARRSTTRCGGSGVWTPSSSRRSCRRCSPGAIATSSSTPSGRARAGRAGVRLSCLRGWQAGRADRGLHAGLRAGQPRARAGPWLVS